MRGLVRSFTPLVSGALLCAVAAPAEAYSIRVEYTYVVTSVIAQEGALNGTVSVGDEYGGYYTVDSTAPAVPTGPSTVYYSDIASFPHETVLGAFVHRSADALPGSPLTVVVVCDACPRWTAPPRDVYQVLPHAVTTRMVTPGVGEESFALLINRVFLHLEDLSLSAIDAGVQPLFLDLEDWPDLFAVTINGGKDLNHNGRIDRDPAPEPTFRVGGELISLRVVIDPVEMTRELVDTVIDLNVAHGIANASDPKLRLALKALDAVHEGNASVAVNALRAFGNLVAAQAGNAIAEEDAAALIALAEDIAEALERAEET